MPFFVHGLDLGKERDYTANVVLQVAGTWSKIEYVGFEPEMRLPIDRVRHIECLPVQEVQVREIERYQLGTKYLDIAADMRKRIAQTPTPRYLTIDKTGVGMGVIEMFTSMNPIGIMITGGKTATIINESEIHVPKADLAANLQVLFQQRLIRIGSSLRHAQLLAKELAAFREKMSNNGHVSYEAWREREHDDMVLALQMAAWFGRLVLEQNYALAMAEIKREQDGGEDPGVKVSPY